MSTLNDLNKRLDVEFASVNAKIEELRATAVCEHEKRQARYAAFRDAAAALSERVCKPRLEALMKRFPEAIYSKLEMRHGRGVRLNFDSELARVELEVAAHPVDGTDDMVITYDLSILPIFLEFERHVELRQPVAACNDEVVGRWLEDRLIAFAKTYLAVQFTEPYQRRHEAIDPVAGVRFPIAFAAASLVHQGVTHHFLSEQTKAAFERDPEAFVPPKVAAERQPAK